MNIYSCATKSNLNKLILKQKQAIRTICRANYRDHTAPLFRNLNILPIEKLVTFYRVKFMHSYVHRNLPLSFSEIWTTNRERNPERLLRDADALYVPPHRIELFKRMPLCALPTAWNEAPQYKENPAKHLFLKKFKAHLLESVV